MKNNETKLKTILNVSKTIGVFIICFIIYTIIIKILASYIPTPLIKLIY